ncbi:hypothetical protein ABZ354_16650 [Streptomyces sp. NPDC005925]|uniref:hypothetical protein n=1 Tax=Streptomyces sp. NPDC005925 TaxID=3157172 RepID=UPI003400F29B
MHRTTTSATLLVTMAVSVLTGCVTVERPSLAGVSAAPARPPAPGADERQQPRIVQAPAREALDRVSPSREAEPDPSAPRRPSAPAPGRDGQPERSRQPPHLRPAPPVPLPPRADLPGLADDIHEDVRGGDTDVCALGDKYGGWRQGSPESAICREAQGR